MSSDYAQKLPRWQQRLHAALANNNGHYQHRFMQLATVDEWGFPAVRTVVFRGFHPKNQRIIAHTDMRSDKVRQLQRQPQVQLCWYFSTSREQFRINARCNVLGPEDKHYADLRQQHWQTLSNSAQSAYFHDAPGVPFGSEADSESVIPKTATQRRAPAVFCLLLFAAEKVDYLDLMCCPHNREIHQLAADDWKVTAVVP